MDLSQLIAVAAAHPHFLPDWLRTPDWWRPAQQLVRIVVNRYPGFGLLLVIFCEELGIPLPVPGDVAIISSGYLVSTGHLSFIGACAAVMTGSVSGSFILFSLSRRYGTVFLHRYGRYIGLTEKRVLTVESAFRRWGPLTIIFGRQVPGMRVILSAFAGSFGMRARVFVPSVVVSSALWSASLVALGMLLGRRAQGLFRLLPAHLLPYLAVLIGLLVIGYHLWERRRQVDSEGNSASNLVKF